MERSLYEIECGECGEVVVFSYYCFGGYRFGIIRFCVWGYVYNDKFIVYCC